MAVTLGSSGVTFSDGTTQTSKGSVLGSVQYSGYQQIGVGGINYPTSEVYTDFYSSTFSGLNSPSTGSSQNTVFCGFAAYRSGTYNTDNDTPRSPADSQYIQVRLVYRSVS